MNVYEALEGQRKASEVLLRGKPDELSHEFGAELENVTRWLGLSLAIGGERARTYVLEPDVVTLLDVAAADFPPGPYRVEEAPARIGFMWLPAPMPVMLLDGDHEEDGPTIVQAIAWAQDSQGDCLMVIFTGETNSSAGMVALRVGDDAPDHSGLRWMRAFWAFVEQRVVVSTPAPVSRQVRRATERGGQTWDGVRVVTLRRLAGGRAGSGGAAVAWSHRWMVGGHWRQQPYRRSGTVKRIWIWPYVKGPGDKPLVAKAAVYDVAR